MLLLIFLLLLKSLICLAAVNGRSEVVTLNNHHNNLPSKSSQLQLQPHGSLTFRNLRSFPHLKLEAKMQMSPHNNMMMKSKPEAQKNKHNTHSHDNDPEALDPILSLNGFDWNKSLLEFTTEMRKKFPALDGNRMREVMPKGEDNHHQNVLVCLLLIVAESIWLLPTDQNQLGLLWVRIPDEEGNGDPDYVEPMPTSTPLTATEIETIQSLFIQQEDLVEEMRNHIAVNLIKGYPRISELLENKIEKLIKIFKKSVGIAGQKLLSMDLAKLGPAEQQKRNNFMHMLMVEFALKVLERVRELYHVHEKTIYDYFAHPTTESIAKYNWLKKICMHFSALNDQILAFKEKLPRQKSSAADVGKLKFEGDLLDHMHAAVQKPKDF